MPDTTNQPNILFLLSDEHSFRFMNHLSEAEGGEPVDTPFFDRLVSQGTRFTNAYCQVPLCTPSRLCMLTGLPADRAGAWSNNSVLSPELTTLPGHLADHGYATCLVGKMHLGGDQQFVGFQHRPYGDLTGQTGHQWDPIGHPNRQGMRERTSLAGVTHAPESLLQEHVIAEESLAWLREHRAAQPDQPWFLTASFSRPHFPLTAPKRWMDRYWPNGTTEPRVPAGGDAYDHPMSAGMRKGFKADDIDHDEMMYARAGYFACVSYLDEILGDMLVRLEAAGLLDNTIVIYSSDHGEMAGEHGVWWKNGWYESCTHVPFIISTPEQRRGQQAANVCTSPTSLLDLFPTCCGFAGIDQPDAIADAGGVDLSPATQDASTVPDDRPVYTDEFVGRWGRGTAFRSIRWKHYKYVTFNGAPPLMFDLDADPGEQRNLLQHQLAGDAAEAKAFLEKHAAECIDFSVVETAGEKNTALHHKHPKRVTVPKGDAGNCYIFPDGRLVSADHTLYNPAVIAENAADAFGDWPG